MHYKIHSYIIGFVVNKGPSPNGKATDSDSVISRFESLWAWFLTKLIHLRVSAVFVFEIFVLRSGYVYYRGKSEIQ